MLVSFNTKDHARSTPVDVYAVLDTIFEIAHISKHPVLLPGFAFTLEQPALIELMTEQLSLFIPLLEFTLYVWLGDYQASKLSIKPVSPLFSF